MARSRVFFPRQTLDAWLEEDSVELSIERLTMKSTGQVYQLTEAIRVLREVSGTPDGGALEGKVKAMADLRELGAEFLGDSMVLGDNAYEIVLGWLGAPEPVRSQSGVVKSGEDQPSEAKLLAEFLLSSWKESSGG